MAKRKNIIFYFSDQQRWDTVNETVTPNLMQLAKEGTLFEQLYLPAGVRPGPCLPANRCVCYPVRLLLERHSPAGNHYPAGPLL